MFATLQNPLALVGRILLAVLFIPAGFSKITGFAGTGGMPRPWACRCPQCQWASAC